MSMRAAAQRDKQVSSLSLDLNPPVRAESIDLRVLIGHRTATQASASVESVADTFKTGTVNFVAVLEGQRLLGMCSRQEIAALLGGRYGFSLWAR
jgi:sigma-B regulation protein RsbU (phosphoserine phosphatase)